MHDELPVVELMSTDTSAKLRRGKQKHNEWTNSETVATAIGSPGQKALNRPTETF